LRSFADGGRHYGEHVFTLGLALTTPNPLQSAQLIQHTAIEGNEPWKVWEEMGLEDTRDFLRRLGTEDMDFAPESPLYVVATFQNIRLAPWICYYGTWDFSTQQGVHARVASIKESFNLDWENGEMVFQDEPQPVPVKSIHVLSSQGRKDRTYEGNTGPHLVLNSEDGRYFALDDLAFHSMLTQLLVAPADIVRFQRHFELVHDDFPWVRIYRVRQDQPGSVSDGGTAAPQ
jgi:dolichyl-diphosphooligosaccharide--protein glycosyltransferase